MFRVVTPHRNLSDLGAHITKNFVRELEAELSKAIVGTAKDAKADLDNTDRTWNRRDVIFTVSSKNATNLLSSGVYGSGDIGLWEAINAGFTVRGRGSTDYSPKTIPNILSSFPGSGWWNSSVNQFNTVEARNWTGLLMNKYETKAYAYLKITLDNFVSKFY